MFPLCDWRRSGETLLPISFLCDVPLAWVVDEFSFPEPDERASSMPDNMLQYLLEQTKSSVQRRTKEDTNSQLTVHRQLFVVKD
jgi:hypothetical protein